MQLFLKLKVYF